MTVRAMPLATSFYGLLRGACGKACVKSIPWRASAAMSLPSSSPTPSNAKTSRKSHKILQAFQVPFIWQNKLLLIRASIGASLYPENADSCEQLLHHADHAMYQQKIVGGNGVSFFRQPMNATDEAAYLIL